MKRYIYFAKKAGYSTKGKRHHRDRLDYGWISDPDEKKPVAASIWKESCDKVEAPL